MHQRDYILRIIEQLGAFLIALRKRLLRGDDTSAVDGELAGIAAQAGFDLELLRRFELETLHMLVAPAGEVEPARCWLMAEVLYVDGLSAHLADDPEGARPSLIKARALYDLVRPRGGMLVGLPEAAERIDEIDRLLDEARDERDGGADRSSTGRARSRRRRALAPRPVPATPA